MKRMAGSPAPADLLAWYDQNARRLPWRKPPRPDRVNRSGPDPTGGKRTARAVREKAGGSGYTAPDPYRIWVAEVMLIQTRVETVIRYYRDFLQRFPDVASLAAADLDEVLKAWEGMGYYARARNLHRAARLIVSEHGRELPSDYASLMELPGIGEYVAAAVASIAFGERRLAIDGNVRRVLSRLYDLENPRSARLRKLAGGLVGCDRPGDINQALMDLGSTVCTPRDPACGSCPLEGACLARARGTQNRRPGVRSRRDRPHKSIAAGVVWRDGRILIARRPQDGLLGGLWEFPGGKIEAAESPPEAVVREVREELGVEVEPADKIAAVDHAYSHFSITLHAYHCRYVRGTPRALGCDAFAWATPAELEGYAFPAANKQILERIIEQDGDQ